MQFDLDKSSQLFKNVKNLFTVAKNQVIKCKDKEFVILKFLERDYGFSLFTNSVEYLGFPVECLYVKNGDLNIVQNNIFCLANWIENTSEFKKENIEFIQSRIDGKLIIQDKPLGVTTLNNI